LVYSLGLESLQPWRPSWSLGPHRGC
jgi:hypothetical protein